LDVLLRFGRTVVSAGLVLLVPWLNGVISPVEAGGRYTKKGPCAKDLDSCTPRGCADVDTDLSPEDREAEALLNMLKRTKPQNGTPIQLTFADFVKLQQLADDLVGQGQALSAEQRSRLRDLRLSESRTVSEGDLVELRGFIVQDSPRPKPSGPESVNCRLSRAANNDIHIPIVEEAQDEEFAAIVVEMIPQARPGSWNPTKLKGAARDERPVIIRGRLFYDNKHEVNDDSEHDNGQPKRFSLWEIHPISEFWVCIRADRKCGETLSKPKDWKKLADF